MNCGFSTKPIGVITEPTWAPLSPPSASHDGEEWGNHRGENFEVTIPKAWWRVPLFYRRVTGKKWMCRTFWDCQRDDATWESWRWWWWWCRRPWTQSANRSLQTFSRRSYPERRTLECKNRTTYSRSFRFNRCTLSYFLQAFSLHASPSSLFALLTGAPLMVV